MEGQASSVDAESVDWDFVNVLSLDKVRELFILKLLYRLLSFVMCLLISQTSFLLFPLLEHCPNDLSSIYFMSFGADTVSSASELSKSSTEEFSRGGHLVSKSRERAKQNSALARSQSGNRKGALPRNDSRLVHEDKDRRLLQSDYF